MGTAGKAFVVMAYANLVILFLVLGCVSIWKWGFPVSLHPAESHVALGRMQTGCLDCHQTLHLGICSDWQHSAHAKAGVGCADCHRSGTDDSLTSKSHLENASMAIAVVVTPKICSRCHLQQAAEYGRSKHAHTYEIIWKIDYWLRYGMNNAIERTSGCYSCHGTVVKLQDGEPVPETWPNVGVGRVNPDGSLAETSGHPPVRCVTYQRRARSRQHTTPRSACRGNCRLPIRCAPVPSSPFQLLQNGRKSEKRWERYACSATLPHGLTTTSPTSMPSFAITMIGISALPKDFWNSFTARESFQRRPILKKISSGSFMSSGTMRDDGRAWGQP